MLFSETIQADDLLTLKLSGEMYAGNTPDLNAIVSPYLGTIPPRNVVVEMSNVAFLDVSGITTLLRLHKAVAENGGELKLTGVAGMVKELCVLCHLDKIMSIDGSAAPVVP